MKKLNTLLFMLILIFSFTLPASAATFDDVKQYKEEIGYLTSKGIINGYSDGTFKPEKPINRIQAVTMILREKKITNFDAPNPNFRDIKPGSHEFDIVAKAVELGIISGKTDSKTGEKYFDPYGSLTRAQMAKILVLAYGLDGNYIKDFTDVRGNHWAYDYIDVLAGNNITTGFQDGTFKPEQNLSRQHFAVFMARLLDDRFKVNPNKQLTTSEIAKLNDEKVVLIEMDNGQGSGVIVGNGLILTNYHVIEGSTAGVVYLHDGTTYTIDGVVEYDVDKDLALIKTTKAIHGVNPVKIGSYNSLNKGDKIVAIGSPKGLQNTVSEGIVSSLRFMDGVQYIQNNAPIDHGSSGGGLFNSKGELVGITTWGLRDNIANLNFAVAIDEAIVWSKYFSMKFEDIKANPLKSSNSVDGALPIDGFNNISLGMTKEQVKKAEPSILISETSDTLLYTSKQVMGFLGDVSYEFVNNKLVAINVFHYVVDNQYDLDVLEGYFLVMLEDLSAIYGSPSLLDANWYDDSDGYVLNAYWVRNANNTLLVVKINYDFSTYGGIRISIF